MMSPSPQSRGSENSRVIMNTNAKRVLIVVTSNDRFGDTGRKTGYYLPEVSHPVARFKKAGLEVDVASPKGGKAPMDPSSVDRKDAENVALLSDVTIMGKLDHTLTPDEVKTEHYDAIFFAGGSSLAWNSTAASVTAPEGSGTKSLCARNTRIATRISSSCTAMMPST